jgi:FKBP-type peptidyl-prolyl cis-trans isomerase SlpA
MSNLPFSIVTKDSYITLHYSLATIDGAEVVSTFQDNPATLQLGQGQLAPPLEACLLGLSEGENRVFILEPSAAFGIRNSDLIQRISKTTLEQNSEPGHRYQIGDLVEFAAPAGGQFAGVLCELDDDGAVFDFNHPLAGREVKFTVKIIGIL